MAQKSRDEIIVLEIARSGTKKSKDAAWKYLRSVSARAEAELVNVSDITQNKIILAVGRLKLKELKEYNTQKLIETVKLLLGKLIGDSEVLSRRMITANVLSGKLKNILNNPLKDEALQKAVSLSDSDVSRINKMVSDHMDNIKHGVSLTLASVSALIQKAAINSNMPVSKPKEEKPETKDKAKKEKDNAPKQEPISNEFDGMFVEPKRPSLMLLEKVPSKQELAKIASDPIAFASSASTANVEVVKGLQKDYADRTARNESILKQNKGTGEISGIVREMRENGVSAFIDKGGKRWSLINYCAMTVRTISTKSDNIGEVFSDDEHDLYYIVPHSHSCPICKKVEGKVYSRSGKDKRFPPLASVFKKIDPAGTDDLDNTHMIIHPNCRHKIIRYIEPNKKNKRK